MMCYKHLALVGSLMRGECLKYLNDRQGAAGGLWCMGSEGGGVHLAEPPLVYVWGRCQRGRYSPSIVSHPLPIFIGTWVFLARVPALSVLGAGA